LSALEFVQAAGARPIVADLSDQRLRFVSEKKGVVDTLKILGNETDIERLEGMTEGRRADAVIDATGNHRSMSNAINMAAFAGRVAYVGITQQNLEFPHAPAMHRRELTLLASRNALPGDFTRIIQLIEQGVIDTNLWITHHAGFGEVSDAFPGWTNPDSGVLKAVIHVD
jgi:alcohol dehydrogenase